jgi:tRNA A58 N-methylase Trm61
MIDINKYLASDACFNELFPCNVQKCSRRHWTPLEIIERSIDFLAEEGSKILDIGSGVGKFCLTGAYYAPNAHFYGVEQRYNLVDHAIRAQEKLGIKNVSFIKGNFTKLNLQEFDHFYFFNSFFENLDYEDHIDEKVECSPALFDYYNHYLYSELQKMRPGTKIVTYHSILEEIPRDYELIKSLEDADLNFWMKRG